MVLINDKTYLANNIKLDNIPPYVISIQKDKHNLYTYHKMWFDVLLLLSSFCDNDYYIL